jgi:hypothetical protein
MDLTERLKFLNQRLLAWQLCGQLQDVFSAALRRYERDGLPILEKAGEAENMLDEIKKTPFDLLLTSFEESLEDLDNLIEITNDMDDWIGE